VSKVRGLYKRAESGPFFVRSSRLPTTPDFLEGGLLLHHAGPGPTSVRGIHWSWRDGRACRQVQPGVPPALHAHSTCRRGAPGRRCRLPGAGGPRALAEREADEALRRTQKTILKESSDFKELEVHFELAPPSEEATTRS